MISTSAILPLLSLIKWPATLTGAILVFGLSTDGTLSLISSNAHKFTKPVAVSNDFNMPPVRQIADLDPMTIVPATPSDKSDAVALPQMQTTTVALRQPEAVTLVTPIAIEQTNLPLGRIGDSAVNMRSGPSKTSAKLGTLAAGTAMVGLRL